MGSNREKSNIAITIWGKLPFLMGNKLYYFAFHFDGSNNIFVNCDIFSNRNLFIKSFCLLRTRPLKMRNRPRLKKKGKWCIYAKNVWCYLIIHFSNIAILDFSLLLLSFFFLSIVITLPTMLLQ